MTPLVPTKTAVLPPPPLSTNRLYLLLSAATTFGAGCWAPPCSPDAAIVSDSAPTASSAPRTIPLLISSLLLTNPVECTSAHPDRSNPLGSPRRGASMSAPARNCISEVEDRQSPCSSTGELPGPQCDRRRR